MKDLMRFTILGCGSSPGVPRIGGDWGACNPNNPKNRRQRCSLAIERVGACGTTTVVVDTGPDFREQMLQAEIRHLDGVLYTHSHADHVHGIDDLRAFALIQKERINAYADADTVKRLYEGFGYCFMSSTNNMYPPIMEARTVQPLKPIRIVGEGGEVSILPVPQKHGPIESTGFRFVCGKAGDVCYSPDISGVESQFEPFLQDLNVWIVGALQYRPHVSHFSLPEALCWINKLRPRRAFLTHMHIPMDYDEVQDQTPDHVQPAYDGLSFSVELESH